MSVARIARFVGVLMSSTAIIAAMDLVVGRCHASVRDTRVHVTNWLVPACHFEMTAQPMLARHTCGA